MQSCSYIHTNLCPWKHANDTYNAKYYMVLNIYMQLLNKREFSIQGLCYWIWFFSPFVVCQGGYFCTLSSDLTENPRVDRMPTGYTQAFKTPKLKKLTVVQSCILIHKSMDIYFLDPRVQHQPQFPPVFWIWKNET